MSPSAAQALPVADERCRLEMTRDQLAVVREAFSVAQSYANERVREARLQLNFWKAHTPRHPETAPDLKRAEAHYAMCVQMAQRFQDGFVVLYMERSV